MRLLLSGYYGFRNTGDEAVLAGIIDGLRRRVPGVEIGVLSADPASTAAEYDVEATDRWRTPSIWKALRWCDVLIQGGGSLLQDVTSPQSPVYYLGVLHMARLARRPYMIFAQGIGPLNSPFLRGVTVRNLRRARAITVRDDESAQMLCDWGVNQPEVRVTADPGLLVAPSPEERRRELLRSLGLTTDQPYLVIALREWPGLQELLPHIVGLLRQREEELLVLPFQFERDLPLALDLSRMLPTRVHLPAGLLSPADSVALIKGARGVIAMRLHAMIFAASVQAPALAIAYDPKVDAFCKRSGHPLLHLSEITPERLQECLAQAMSARAAETATARLEALRRAAERNFDVLLETLQALKLL